MDLSLYIQQQYYLVVVLLYGLGFTIKRYTKIPNSLIPILLAILGAVACGWMDFSHMHTITPESIIQGILCGLTAVGTNQIIKQTVKNITPNDSEE